MHFVGIEWTTKKKTKNNSKFTETCILRLHDLFDVYIYTNALLSYLENCDFIQNCNSKRIYFNNKWYVLWKISKPSIIYIRRLSPSTIKETIETSNKIKHSIDIL